MATYTFSYGVIQGKFVDELSFSYPAAGGDSASNPLTLTENDVLAFSTSGSTSGARVTGWIDDAVDTLVDVFSPNPLICVAPGTSTATIQKVGTSNIVSQISFVLPGIGSAFIYYRINVDSVPNVPSISDLTNQPLNTEVTTSFTVSGMTSGKGCHYLTLFNDTQIKVNSGSYTTNAVALNGDTITVKMPTASTYDTIRRGYIFTLDGVGNGVSKAINTVTQANPTGTYGVRVWNASSVVTLDVGSRPGRVVATGSTTLSFPSVSSGNTSVDSNTVTVSGMQNTDDWVVLTDLGQADTTAPYTYNITVTKNSGSFTVTGTINSVDAPDTTTIRYEVLKIG